MAVTSPRLLHPWHLDHSIADDPRNPPPTTATVDLCGLILVVQRPCRRWAPLLPMDVTIQGKSSRSSAVGHRGHGCEGLHQLPPGGQQVSGSYDPWRVLQ